MAFRSLLSVAPSTSLVSSVGNSALFSNTLPFYTAPSSSFSTFSAVVAPNSVAAALLSSLPTSPVTVPILRPFKGHKSTTPPNVVTTSAREVVEFWRQMTLFRRFEIVADTQYKSRLIRGFCHLYDGQEAIVTGMESVLRRTDSVITAYREHCNQIGRGDSVESAMAELFGKSSGCSKGKGGSMHMYLKKGNFYGGNGIVGAQIPLGAGLAFAHKYRKDGGIAVVGFGDGAANQGQIYEAANMAALWKLPLILLCENNEYGMGTSTKRAAANNQFYTRGDYIPGLWIDGMDVLAVKSGFTFVSEYVRSGKGPMWVECSTYRYHGHSMSDPGISYRSRDEVTDIRNTRDPIDRVRALIKDHKWVDESDMKKVEKEIKQQIDDAVEFAKSSKELPIEEMFTEVYRDEPPPFIRTVDFRKSPSLEQHQ